MSGDTAVALVDDQAPAKPSQGDLIRAFLETRRGSMLAKLADLAEAGDPRSLQLALSYLSPVARPEAEHIVVPGLREAATVRAKAAAIIEAVAGGLISVEAGERVFRMLDLHERAVTVAELAEDVKALKSGGRAPLQLAQRADDDHSDLA